MSGKSRTLLLFLCPILFLFDSNDVSTTNALAKITVTGDGSNNSGVWGRSPPAAGGWWGFGGGDPNVEAIFQFY